jgi:hypothetical protein
MNKGSSPVSQDLPGDGYSGGCGWVMPGLWLPVFSQEAKE